MAFFPNTADPAPIILHHTPSDTASPALLYPGEAAVCHGPTHTKMWIGDGVTNRLFLSTNPADSPLLNQTVLGGPFLPLSGGTLTGPGNLTLDGGTLSVSGAIPTMTWNRTGTDPAQWELRAQGEVWSMYEGGELLFRTSRNATVTPPVYSSYFFNQLGVTPSLAVSGGASFSGHLQAIGVGGPGTGITASRLIVNEGTYLNGGAAVAHHVYINGSVPVLRLNELSPVTGPAALGEMWASGIAGVDNSVAYGQSIIGARIRFNATQGWQRDDGPVDQLGAEIAFFVSANGGPTTYRAMTLGQDGNLKLLHSNPTVATDVITLGYLTGASTGFLPLTGGTLTGPGNLAVNGTLAVSNSDTTSATITNSGSGATGLSITALGVGTVGLDVTAGTGGGRAIMARGFVQINSASSATSLFDANGLNVSLNWPVGTPLRVNSQGGGIYIHNIRPADTPDAPGTYGLGIGRNVSRTDYSPATGCAFIQLLSLDGYAITTHGALSGSVLGSVWFGGYDGSSAVYPYDPQVLKSAAIYSTAVENWSGTGHGSRILFDVTPNGTTTAQTALTIDHDRTLRAPGNVVIDGTLAVSNSDTTSATITNTGSGATVLQINRTGSGGIGVDITAPSVGSAGSALRANGQVYIDNTQGTIWNFSSSLVGSTINTLANCINLTGTGGGLFVLLATTRPNDPEGIYALGISRNSTAGTCPFIQMFDASGHGLGPSHPGRLLGSIWFGGYDATSAVHPYHPHELRSAAIYVEPSEVWSGTGHGSRILFDVTPNGTTTAQTALIVENDLNVTVTGTVTASGSLLTSDPALKTDIADAPPGALAKVCELPVINFRWKHGRDSKMHRGFSADDVRRVMGEDSGCSAEGAYSLADMNAVLWQAVQQLVTEVRELRSYVDGSKSRRSH